MLYQDEITIKDDAVESDTMDRTLFSGVKDRIVRYLINRGTGMIGIPYTQKIHVVYNHHRVSKVKRLSERRTYSVRKTIQESRILPVKPEPKELLIGSPIQKKGLTYYSGKSFYRPRSFYSPITTAAAWPTEITVRRNVTSKKPAV